MARKNSQKKKINTRLLLIVGIIIFLLVLVVVIGSKNKSNSSMTQEEMAKINKKYQEERNQEIVKDLYGKSEQERMQYYCSKFFRLVDTNNYESAYELLYYDTH